jgi:ribokinase
LRKRYRNVLTKYKDLKMLKSILIVGSSNVDMVVRTARFPKPGETLLGGDFLMNAGGKGANQAVAAARLGGNVTFICKLGKDVFGSQSSKLFEAEGINTSHILLDDEKPSGVALITVDDAGENNIVVAPGANARLSPEDLDKLSPVIDQAGFILMQLEIPLETVIFVAKRAFASGAKVILNPAPACTLPDELYGYLSIITPNEKEASLLTGIEVTDIASAKRAAKALQAKGVQQVIITMGEQGALILDGDEFTSVAAPVVEAIDTTAAGDVFNGALIVALSEGADIIKAASFACQASAISVTRFGAQVSIPLRKEIKDYTSN